MSIFDGIHQKEISIRGTPAKSPLFFQDFSVFGGFFTADLKAAKDFLPDMSLQPIRITPTKALVGVFCFDYRACDLAPYREFCVAIALRDPEKKQRSIYSLASGLFTNVLHGFVVALPVTTQLSVYGGVDFFNFPKTLCEVNQLNLPEKRSFSIADPETKNTLVEVDQNLTHNPSNQKSRVIELFTHPHLNGGLQKARFTVQLSELAFSLAPNRTQIQIHERLGNRDLLQLKLGRNLLSFVANRCQGVLYEPEPLALKPFLHP